MSKTRNPIGTTFKKENIFLATVNHQVTGEEAVSILKDKGYDLDREIDSSAVSNEANRLSVKKMFLAILEEGFEPFIRQEYDIFYKDENGYTRFFMEGNETFVGDNSDGKGKLYNIVPACEYYRGYELVEGVNDKGEPVIVDLAGQGENNPLERYNRDYNLKSDKENN